MKKIFTNSDQLPRLTPMGFMKTKVPPKIWNIIWDSYNVLKQLPPKEEIFDDSDPKYKDNSYAEMFDFINCNNRRNMVGI